MELLVKRETVVRSMDKENFNQVIENGTDVKILKINEFDIKDEKGALVGVTNSFIVRLTKDGKSKIATLPGKVLFSSKVSQGTVESAVDTTKDENFDAFYESIDEDGAGENINLKDFEAFKVIRTSPLKETRSAILSKQGTSNPDGNRYQLSDYADFDAILKANGGSYTGLNYDGIYESGPKSPTATPLKVIFISK